MNSSIPISRSQSTAAFFPFNSETAGFPLTQWRPLRLWEPSQMQSYSRFNQAKLKPVSNLEKLLVGAANSDDFSEHLEEMQRSCFGTYIHCGRLGHQLYLAHDTVKTTLPKVRQVTNIRNIQEKLSTQLPSPKRHYKMSTNCYDCI